MFGRIKSGLKPEKTNADDYEVKRQLGRGGFATVYAAHQRGKAEGVDVAMKVIPLERYLKSTGLSLDQLKARMKQFIILTTNKGGKPHPNVTGAFDYRFSKSDFYIFLEIYRGGDLFGRILDAPEGHLTEDESRQVAHGLVGALQYTHQHGWIHRDLKPENIFFKKEDSRYSECILGDYGCAINAVSEGQLFYDSAGSPGYTAPEMVAGRGYSFATDMFSLGILLYACLTGRSPFISEDPYALNQEVLYRAVPFPRKYWSHLSLECKDFVDRCVEKDPRKRLTAAQAMRHPWITGESHVAYESDSDESWTAEAHRVTSVLSRAASKHDALHSYISNDSADSVGMKTYKTSEVLDGSIPEKYLNQITDWDSRRSSNSSTMS